jgi:hypothetical protein
LTGSFRNPALVHSFPLRVLTPNSPTCDEPYDGISVGPALLPEMDWRIQGST